MQVYRAVLPPGARNSDTHYRQTVHQRVRNILLGKDIPIYLAFRVKDIPKGFLQPARVRNPFYPEVPPGRLFNAKVNLPPPTGGGQNWLAAKAYLIPLLFTKV